ncbi:adhesin [Shewanella sp. 10N.286.55.A9]|uniref:T1SS-143 repeat domain-containing protein n=1 Tax=Shewanella sp. 10N.286.55.A9 TaxID=3229720 RepID=UPI003553E9BE
MIVDSIDVLYYVKIGSSVFAIANDGQWHAISSEQVINTLPLYDINAEDILINDQSAPYIVVVQQVVTIPNTLLINSSQNPSTPSSTQPNSPDSQAPDNAYNKTPSSETQGLNYFYNVIQTQYNALIAQSGYNSQGDNLLKDTNNISSLIGEQDSFVTLTLSVNIDDANDGYLNRFEVPSVSISGQALDAINGQILSLKLTDVHGQQLYIEVTVINESWRLDNVDISNLAEGLLNAEISAPTYQGIAEPAFDNSVKDTLASISIEIEDLDNVINAAEISSVIIKGTVVNVEDGQTIMVTLSDANGSNHQVNTTVANGIWTLPPQDLSDFDQGSLIATAEVIDIAGNPVSATTQLPVDTLADITIEIIDNDGVINATEITQVAIQGTVTNVEDGQIVTVTLTDNQGHSLMLTTIVTGGIWVLPPQDLTAFDDGYLIATAEVSDVAGNPVSATTGDPIDILAAVNITVDTGNDEFVNRFEMKKLDFSGSVFDVENGQAVTITITDVDGKTLTYTTQVVDGIWRIENADIEALVDGELRFDVNTQDIAGNPASSSTTVIKDTVANVTINVLDSDQILNQQDIDDLNTIFGVANNIEDGQVIFITVTDSLGQVFTLSSEVNNGLWTASGLDASDLADGILHLYAVAIDAEGNPAFATNTIIKDTLADITVEIIDNDGVLNAAEMTQVSIQGTVANVEDGQTVTVTMTDNQGNSLSVTTVVINGTWNLPPQDLSNFDDGSLIATAEVNDIAGNLASNSTQILVDTSAEISVEIIDNDGVINTTELSQVIIQGRVSNIEDGQLVTVTLTDDFNNSLTLTTTIINGVWSLAPQDLSAFDDGSLLVTAIAYDNAGNQAQGSTSIPIDTTAAIDITIIDNDGVINAAEMNQVVIQGSVTNVEDGQTVTVNLTDNQGHSLTLTTIVTSGVWILPAQDLSAFDDGSLAVTAEVSDIAGNPASATAQMPVDILADITIDVDTGGDSVINRFEMLRLDFSGQVDDVEDGQTITITLTDSLNNQLTFNTTVVAGVWQISDADVSSLVDGNISFTANTIDIAGNPTSVTAIVSKDSQASVTIEAVDDDNTLNAVEVPSTTLRGEALNIEDGQNVLIWVTDSSGTRLIFNTSVVDGQWQLDNLDLSSLLDGELTLRALAVDVEGNPSIGNNTVAKDTAADITVEIVDNDGVINATEMTQVVIQGSVSNIEDGQIVTVNLTDNQGHSLTVTAIVTGGVWTLPAQDLSTFDDGSLAVTAEVSDVAGNPASATTQMPVDTTALIDITIIDNDGVINAVEMTQVVIQGTVTNVEDGQTVTVNLTDSQGHSLTLTAIVTGGVWILPAQDLSSFDDGSLLVTAEVSDVAGNPATVSAQMPVDTTASITVEIVDSDSFINQTELSAVIVSGTVTNIEAGQQVRITLTDANNVSTTVTTTVNTDGTYSITAQDLAALGFVDGTLTATATAIDIAGNSATASDQVLIDTQVTIDIDTGADGFDVGLFTYGRESSLAGTTTGVEQGQTVTLTLTDGITTKTFTTTVNADGSWLFDDTLHVDGLNQRMSWQMEVSVSDLAGNTAVDDMPSLDIPNDGYLYELALNINNQTGAEFSFDIPDAVLSLSADQSFLLRSQSNGQDLSIVIAPDGLSFQVFRNGDNELVLEAALTGADLQVTLFQPLDNPAIGKLSTFIRLEGVQTDTDGTTEKIITYAILHAKDTPELAIDDHFTVIEDTSITGSITGNDYTIEGPLIVESINFNGTDYAVAIGAPAVIDTGKGELTVLYNGFWRFVASDNLDNTIEQSISFDYTVTDFDGSIATATSTITIIDGAIGIMADATFTTSETVITSPNSDTQIFTITAGSDTIIPSSVVFSALSLIPLTALGLTSNGDAISYALSGDAKSIIATANGVTVFSLSLSAISNGDDVNVTATMNIERPLDHSSSDSLELATLIDAVDIDGSHIDLGNLNWAINDGSNALIDNISTLTFDEANLIGTPLVQTGQFDIQVGADAINTLGFDANELPVLTAGGEQIMFDISVDGLTLTAYVGDIGQPIFTIEIDNNWNLEADTLSHNYTTTLYQPFDQVGTDEVNIGLFITDFDGDTTQANMMLIVQDDDPGDITGISLEISELPSITPGVNNRVKGLIDITTKGDPIVDIKFDLYDFDPVLDSDGQLVTQNGSTVYWVISDNGATAEGQLSDGTLVFRMALPADIHIDAESTAQIDFSMQLFGPIDNQTGAGTENTINVDILATDTDSTGINAVISIDIYDGITPNLPASLSIAINEGELVDNISVLSSAILNIDGGSDDISNIELAAGFSFGSYTSDGQAIVLSNFADGSGWYNAIRTGDNSDVFRIRFNANGKVEFEQFAAVDHPDGNGENNLTMSFEVVATDADGDQSNNQTININIQDDVPIQNDSSLTFTEENNTEYSVNLFNQKQQGADGAQVSKFIYDGTEYSAGDSVELFTDTGVKYGTLVITADGKATVTSVVFEYAELFYSEDVQVYVTDTDGDTVIDNLTITANDKAGSIKVLNPNFTEDTPGLLAIVALPGDIDEGEIIQSIIINKASLADGTLTLDGQPVSLDADGNYILQGSDLFISNLGIAIPNGDLVFHPPEDASDATLAISAQITVNINNKPSITTEVPFSIASVADTPEWESNSQFSYDVNEDAGAIDISINATTKDIVGTDPQGSEVIIYAITNIAAGITITSTNSDGVEFSIANGQEISADELALLQVTVDDNLAGEFSFDVTALSTEPDNGSTAPSSTETVVIKVTPVADTTTLVTRDITSQEDVPIALNLMLFGSLTDNSGSENLHFELTLPTGWAIDAPSAVDLGNGVWTVSFEDVFSAPPAEATLIPLADASSANLGDFDISVRSYATESSQDGIDPVDNPLNPNPNYSQPQNVTISLTGVANDAPTINSDPNVWEITDSGDINSVVPFNEDSDIPLSFTVISSDDDGSESLSLRLVGLPDGASFIDSNGQTVNLSVVDFDNGLPVYSVTATELSTLSIRPPEDFSGQINLTLFVESTELDGDIAEYELNLNIDIAPVIDETSDSLKTTSLGKEDQPIVLNLMPALLADMDGSETITGMTIFPSSEGMIYLFDGAEITVSSFGSLLSELTDEFSPTLTELLNSGRLAVLPPQDADGPFTLDVSYQITDTSETGATTVQEISSQLSVEVDAVVEVITRLQINNTVLYSSDGQPITLTDDIVFFDGDIDGSEVIDYIVITMPSADGWFVTHPNGAINDGDGRWIIPSNNMTNDTTQEQALSILEGMTISSEHATVLQGIIVEARVLDRDDPEIITANIFVTFDQPTSTSTASTVTALQATDVDATEDSTINFAGHLNLSITSDNNDVISFRVLASDLPQGGYFTGSDVIALYDSSGENIIEYVFTTASLSNLALHNISEDFSGDLTIPIRIIATDSLSGDTKIDDSQNLEINITPVADGVTLESLIDTMDEDDPKALGLFLAFADTDATANTGGEEKIILDDPAQLFTITLLDGGQLIDNTGLFQLKSGTDDTWEFTGNTNVALNNALALLQFSPPEHLSGDFRLQISGSVSDTADIDGANVIDNANFSDTITIQVTPVTDAAEVPADLIIIHGSEDTNIALAGIDSSVIGLIDVDGSEVQYITIQGVPEGATVYYQDAGGNLQLLPNNGADGGQFNGSPTSYWTITPDQLDSIVIKPPQNFNGDMSLSLSIITQELGTDDFVTTSMDFLVGVSPVADGVQIISDPDDYSAIEGDAIKVELGAELIDLEGHESIRVEVTITSAEATALIDLAGIEIDGQFAALISDGNGGFTASLLVNETSLEEIKILPGELAFGTLQVELALSSIDTAEVLGSNETDQSAAQIVNFEIEITPEVDPPIWTQFGDINALTTNDIPLNLGLELQNPAPGETASLTILGVPDVATLSAGTQQGNQWIVPIESVAGLMISGVTAGTTFELSLDPTATLDGESAEGALETITITVDVNAVMNSPAAMANFAFNDANTDVNPNNLEPMTQSAAVYGVHLEDFQQQVMEEMYQRMQFEYMRQYDTPYRYVSPMDPIDSILPINPVINDASTNTSTNTGTHANTNVISNENAYAQDFSTPASQQSLSANVEAAPIDIQPFSIDFNPNTKPEYGYQDPIGSELIDGELIRIELSPNNPVDDITPIEFTLNQFMPISAQPTSLMTTNDIISVAQNSALSLISVDTHWGDKLIEQPGFGYIQPIPDSSPTRFSQTDASHTDLSHTNSAFNTELSNQPNDEINSLNSLTSAIKDSLSKQETLTTSFESESYLNQSELDEINQLTQQQTLLNQS